MYRYSSTNYSKSKFFCKPCGSWRITKETFRHATFPNLYIKQQNHHPTPDLKADITCFGTAIKSYFFLWVISSFRREVRVDDNCTEGSDNFLTTFRDNLSFPSSRVNNPTSVRDYHYSLRNNTEESSFLPASLF